jgi:hypothetical protein
MTEQLIALAEQMKSVAASLDKGGTKAEHDAALRIFSEICEANSIHVTQIPRPLVLASTWYAQVATLNLLGLEATTIRCPQTPRR